MPRPRARSAVRITATLAVTLGFLWLLAFLYVRQPARSGVRVLAQRASAERLRADVLALARDLVPRDVAHPENLARAADYIAGEFSRAGITPQRERYSARGGEYENVFARIGTCRAPLVVGAHYDAFGEFGANPGADDNASGVAGLLELGRLLAGRSLSRCLDLVAFSTEEPPFFGSQEMGSAVHAARLLARGEYPWGMVSLEMIGYFTKRQKWPSALLAAFYPRRGDFLLLAGRIQDRELIRSLKAGLADGERMRFVSYGGPYVGGLDASDHSSFWARGIPAVILTDSAFLRNPRYHAPDDTPESLDYLRMAEGVEGLANAVVSLPASR